MNSRKISLALSVTLAVLIALTACDHTESPLGVDPPGLDQSSPEAVLETLIESYRTRDIDLYAPLLHPDFRFRFQEYWSFPPELRDLIATWDASHDSTGTAGLFNSPDVSEILINLTYRPAEPAAEFDMQDTMKIRVMPMSIVVVEAGGTIYLAEGDVQDFFFVQGEGELSDRWYILEWRDIPGGGPSAADEGVAEAAVQQMSWGRLKTLYD